MLILDNVSVVSQEEINVRWTVVPASEDGFDLDADRFGDPNDNDVDILEERKGLFKTVKVVEKLVELKLNMFFILTTSMNKKQQKTLVISLTTM